MSKPTPRPGVEKIMPYKPGDSSVEGVTDIIKLASNESPLGASPKVIAAVREAAAHMELYPDGGSTDMRAAIAKFYGLDADLIVAGSGSEQILGLLASAYAGPGDHVVYSEFGFLVYKIASLAAGADVVVAKEQNFTTDVDALLAAVTPETKILFLANPNNPTGTWVSTSEIKRLRDGLPDHVLLVLDAAYAEYVENDDYSAGHALVDEAIQNGTENVVVCHTFSKIYGLAAARVGWCYGPASVIDALNRVRGAFNVNALAQVAAIAALDDVAHVDKARALNNTELPRIAGLLADMGLEPTPSVGNFILVHFPKGADQAARADAYMRSKGVIVRPVAGYGMPQALRISIGTVQQNDRMASNLQDFMAKE
ncbi:MAG: histidinol-phosphate transaminase [Sphingomonadales bacterium]|nr:histidinol-phosphate transaminase [Sphingomonadales bacterium]